MCGPDSDGSSQKFLQIRKAYETLRDEQVQLRYYYSWAPTNERTIMMKKMMRMKTKRMKKRMIIKKKIMSEDEEEDNDDDEK